MLTFRLQKFFTVIFFFSGLLAPFTCQAITNEKIKNNFTSDILQMIWSLLIVIALILLLYALFRKKFSITGTQTDKAIKILEIRPLPGKKSLCLVEVENQKLLLGLAENSINHLTTLSPDTRFDATLATSQQKMEKTTTEFRARKEGEKTS